MAVFKCKMCGGTIEFEKGATVGVCDSCGTKQTLPRLDDEKRANLYDRASHFRRNNDFDKAADIYEQILNEDNTDAEAYWSLVLCRYGIEYVEDPKTHKRIPTVNRAQFTSIYMDEDYKSAIQYADGYQKQIYEEEAKAIDDIQKGILEISSKEEPFDVFICYKETDANGRRTQDSVLANDLYHELTEEGFKVFFSRITLEDKLGTAYEPYIFAALNSAKVMVVLGTKPEYFNAVWVKNEWSRFLSLVKKSNGKKILIPAYRDMDPYDLPDEFSHLQAQDMSKLGFMQDLIRGIKKIISATTPKQTVKETVVVNNATSTNITPLLERAFLFLEDGKWQDANIYCEKVLDINPKNAEAYLGKLMAELRVRTRKQLADCEQPFDGSENYSKIIRFGDEKLENEMRGYIAHINERNENARLNAIYNRALKTRNSAISESTFKTAADTFKSISGFKDSDILAEQCLEKAEICRKDAIYASGKNQMSKDNISGYESAIKTFESISGYKDVDEQIYVCKKKIEYIKAKQEADRLELARKAEEKKLAEEKAKRLKIKIIKIATPIIAACIVFIILLTTVFIPAGRQGSIKTLINEGKYEKAQELIEKNGSFGKTKKLAAMCKAGKAFEKLDYERGINAIFSIGGSITVSYDSNGNSISIESEKIEKVSDLDINNLQEIEKGYVWELSDYFLNTSSYTASITFKCNKIDKEKIYSYVGSGKTSIYFGLYPQTKVTDKSLISTLNTKAGTLPTSKNIYNWTDYGYYIESNIESYMYYIDIDNDSDGTYDYRGVYFTQYRPYNTDTIASYTNQEDNGYNTNTTYWFKYEKVKWNILKTENGKALIVSDLILDSQDYNYTYGKRSKATDYQGNSTKGNIYANNYMYSHIRSWLNETFYETAFNSLERIIIETTTVDNSASSTGSETNKYACSNTNDKMFLLSYKEATTYYSSDSERQARGTDYAKSQGLYVNSYKSPYWLRSPDYNSGDFAWRVFSDGYILNYGVRNTINGVRPACWINLIN